MVNMETKEIEALFERFSNQYGIPPNASKQVFIRLVKITLQYRDMLVSKGEKTLTVEETRQALDELLCVMQTKKHSKDVPTRLKNLITLWYDEIKMYLYH